jgi:hypothetical protein
MMSLKVDLKDIVTVKTLLHENKWVKVVKSGYNQNERKGIC